jgi:hypothetical protein
MHVRHIAASLILTSCAFHSEAPLRAANQPAVPAALALHDATPIRLRLTRDLTFANAKAGELVDFEILDDLRIDGVLVMARGARSTATLTQAEPKTRMGRGGKLGVSLDSLPLLDGGKVSIRVGKQRQPAQSTDSAAPAAAMLKPADPSLLFVFGKDETFPEDSTIVTYVDGEVQLDPARFLVDISFTSNPPGAMVSMYGSPVGRTPFTTRLAPGTYQAVFAAGGFHDMTENISVGPGYSNAVHAAFASK